MIVYWYYNTIEYNRIKKTTIKYNIYIIYMKKNTLI